MLDLAQQPISRIFIGITMAIVVGFSISWFYLGYRTQRGISLLPRYEPRRPVPWTGLDLLAIVFFYFFLISGIHGSQYLVKMFWGAAPRDAQQQAEPPMTAVSETTASVTAEREKTPPRSATTKPKDGDGEETTAHPLAQLLKDKNPAIFALCFLVGVVVVPIFEEFFFRVLFTGWLCSVERQCRRRWPRHFQTLGVLPIHLSSAIFAALHFRTQSSAGEEKNLIYSMGVLGTVSFLVIVFAVAWIVLRYDATARDFGWDGRKWAPDVAAGVVAFFSTALPIYILQIGLSKFLPKEIAPDPIALYFFAVVLGALYFRTNRILPSIVMHMLLNAGSLGLAWATM